MAAVGDERLPGEVEVRVGVVALPHLLDREVEDLRWESLRPACLDGHDGSPVPGAGIRPAPRLPPRAAPATAPRSQIGAGAHGPASTGLSPGGCARSAPSTRRSRSTPPALRPSLQGAPAAASAPAPARRAWPRLRW